MPLYLRQSTASQEVPLGFFVDSTNGDTEETGLTIANTDIKIWKTGATTLANKTSGGATHIANGLYYAVLDATDTDTIGPLVIYCHPAGALATRTEATVLDEAVYDVLFGTTALATTTNITAGTIATVTTVTGLTASDVGAIKTKTDFLPSVTAGNAGGVFIAGTNAATTITTGLTTTFTGNLTGSVGSVTAGVKTYEDGSIWVDTVNGATGTTLYTHGMATAPVAFVTDVTSLIASAKIKRVQVVNNSTITLEATHTGEEWEGHSWTLALGGRNIANSHFIGATVSGTGTGAGAEFMECVIGTVSLPTMIAKACGLSGTFTVTATGIYTFDQCYTAVAAGGDWILDFAAIGATTIGLRHFAGSIEVRNMAAGDVLVVAGTGRITLTAPCAGTMHVRGTFELVPGSATTTITDSARWNEDQRLANVTLADTVTTLTNLPAITANWLTAAGLAADAVTEIQAGLATPTNITAATGVVLSGVTHTGAVIPTVTTVGTLTTYTGNTVQTGDSFARLGAPAGASVSADLAAMKVDTAAILVDTGTTLDGRLPAALTGAGNLKADVLAINGNTTSAAVLAILNGATVVYQGTVTGAATTTSLVDTGLTQADADWWKGRIIIFTSVITMQATDILTFTPGTDTLTFTAVTTAPTGATYVII